VTFVGCLLLRRLLFEETLGWRRGASCNSLGGEDKTRLFKISASAGIGVVEMGGVETQSLLLLPGELST
jgi:hypothetical protein